jgi:hypothetical protein
MGYHGLDGVDEATLVERLTVHGLRLQRFLLVYPMAEQAGVAGLSDGTPLVQTDENC